MKPILNALLNMSAHKVMGVDMEKTMLTKYGYIFESPRLMYLYADREGLALLMKNQIPTPLRQTNM